MNTTVIFAELLVCGVQSFIWIAFFVSLLIGVDLRSFFLTWQSGLVFAALAYALGVIFDRVWDMFARPVDLWIRRKYFNSSEELHLLRIRIFSTQQSDFLSYIDYIRSRMRIARATLFNAFAGAFVSLLFANAACAFLLTAAALLSLFAFADLLKTYYGLLKNSQSITSI